MFEFLIHKPSGQRIIFLFSGLLLLAVISCQNALAPDGSAQIALEIRLAASRSFEKASALTTITRVQVTVFTGVYETESYKELVVKDLTITGRGAQGTISVPIGKDRTFRVLAYDANKFVQYQGNTKSMDIAEKSFTVQIELTPIPPNRPTLSLHVPTGEFSWTKSTALDFLAYELYRASQPGVTLSSALIYTTGAIDSAFHIDDDRLPAGKYYYRVYAVDTENLRSAGSNEVERLHSPVD